MSRLDIFMFMLAVIAYFSIILDLRSRALKIARYDELQDKKRLYYVKLAKQQQEIEKIVAASEKNSDKKDDN